MQGIVMTHGKYASKKSNDGYFWAERMIQVTTFIKIFVLVKIGLFLEAKNMHDPFAVTVMSAFFSPGYFIPSNFWLFLGKCKIAAAMLFIFLHL